MKDDASRDKMFDILEREERKRGINRLPYPLFIFIHIYIYIYTYIIIINISFFLFSSSFIFINYSFSRRLGRQQGKGEDKSKATRC